MTYILFILDLHSDDKSRPWNSNTDDKKCQVDYINYNESTIFHHNFVETQLDSSSNGFFFNKKYPAIMTHVFSNSIHIYIYLFI